MNNGGQIWVKRPEEGVPGRGEALAEAGDKECGAFWEQLLIITEILLLLIVRNGVRGGASVWTHLITKTTGRERWVSQCNRVRHLS